MREAEIIYVLSEGIVMKIIICLSIVAVLIILLYPFTMIGLDDGGTKEYRAVLYSVRFWHSIDDRYESGYYEATEVKVFPFNYLSG